MRRAAIIVALLVVLLTLAWTALAQTGGYDLSWFTVDGGGGTSQSSDGQYAVSSTLGQPDAAGTPGAPGYALVGGFWTMTTPTPPTGSLPDLVVTYTSVVMRGYTGGCITEYAPLVTTVCVANQGAAAGPFLVRAAGYGGGSLEWRVAGLDAGEELCLTMEQTAFGEAMVDADDEVVESDETNNIGYVAIPTAPLICTPTPTPTSTATPTDTSTPTLTPTPTPTSYRVIDLGITVDDSADPVFPGQVFQYIVEGNKIEPVGMVAPNVSMSGELSPAGSIRLTGVYTLTRGSPDLQCNVEEARFQCYAPYDPATVQIEAVADSWTVGPPASLCAHIGFSPPLGGGDPNPDNDRDCEDTSVVVEYCQIVGQVNLQGRTDESGATILIDGTPVTTTASNGQFATGTLAAGDHRVTARHPGHLDSEDDAVPCAIGSTIMPATTLVGGDANNDAVIDILDLVVIGAAYNTCVGDPGFDKRADINGNGCAELLDLVLAAANFRRKGPTDWGTAADGAVMAAGHAQAVWRPPTPLASEHERWDVQLAGAHNLYGIDVTLMFDPTLVEVIDADPERDGVQIAPGPLLAGRPFFVAENQVTVDEEAGVGRIAFAAALLHPAEPIAGRGVVASILFEPVGSPAGPGPSFAIEDVVLADHGGHRLMAEWEGSTIRQREGMRSYLPLVSR